MGWILQRIVNQVGTGAEFRRDCGILRLSAADDREAQEQFAAVSFAREVELAITTVLLRDIRAKSEEIRLVSILCIGAIYQQHDDIISRSQRTGDKIRVVIRNFAFSFATKWTQAKVAGGEI